LHLAAAGHRVEIAILLLAAHSDPNAATNHRKSSPLHYAADGYVTGTGWDPKRQVRTIHCLLSAGAAINAQDRNGAAPLHRAVRTRCASAVRCLLSAGADPKSRNNSGSTPFHLAVQSTGRGGSGKKIAKEAQRHIIDAFPRWELLPSSPTVRASPCWIVPRACGYGKCWCDNGTKPCAPGTMPKTCARRRLCPTKANV